MKKVFAWICALAGLALLAGSSSWPVISRVRQWNNKHLPGNVWYGKYNSEWGDMARMSLLDGVSKFQELKDYKFTPAADNGNKNIDLYLLGDSYVEDIPGYAFANTDAYYYGRGLVYSLNPAKKNILIIQTTERFALSLFYKNEIYDRLKQKGDPHPLNILGNEEKKNYSRVINKNLDYLLFDYNFINAMRRGKAEMNYSVFGRATGDVVLSDDGDHLFFRPTVLPDGIYSSYAPLADSTVMQTVANMNKIYDHYRQEGFAEVYFSIIPNPATILQPDGYNCLIQRIQLNPSLKAPYINVYDIFKRSNNPTLLYRVGDTHWNNNGMQIWLGIVNEELRKKSKEEPLPALPKER